MSDVKGSLLPAITPIDIENAITSALIKIQRGKSILIKEKMSKATNDNNDGNLAKVITVQDYGTQKPRKLSAASGVQKFYQTMAASWNNENGMQTYKYEDKPQKPKRGILKALFTRRETCKAVSAVRVSKKKHRRTTYAKPTECYKYKIMPEEDLNKSDSKEIHLESRPKFVKPKQYDCVSAKFIPNIR